MIIAKHFVEFIIYSCMGWIWESIYCTIKDKKWADRGFLFGPVCPIYGFCAIAASIVFELLAYYTPIQDAAQLPIWVLFLIGMIGSAIFEYTTSWYLEMRFNARWWDYSNQPLNLNGRICLPVSVSFGLAGILIIRYLLPAVSGMDSFIHPLVYEALAIVFAGVLGIDFGLTEASLSTVLKEMAAYKKEWNENAERAYEALAAAPDQMAESLKGRIEGAKEQWEGAKEQWEGAKEQWEEKKEHFGERFAVKLSPAQLHVFGNIESFGRRKDKKNNINRDVENRLVEYVDAWREKRKIERRQAKNG